MQYYFVFYVEAYKTSTLNSKLTTPTPPMEQALPLPYFQPSTAVLAKIRQFARNFRPQPYLVIVA